MSNRYYKLLHKPGGSGGGGDISNLPGINDNEVVRGDNGTGIQGSSVTLDDNNVFLGDIEIGLAANGPVEVISWGDEIRLECMEPSPAAGPTVVGNNIDIKSSFAVASTDTNGAADGGQIILTTGDAARRNTGNANGGDMIFNAGEGIGTGLNGVFRFQHDDADRLNIEPGASGEIFITSYQTDGTTPNANIGFDPSTEAIWFGSDLAGWTTEMYNADGAIVRLEGLEAVVEGTRLRAPVVNAGVTIHPEASTPVSVAVIEQGSVYTNEGAGAQIQYDLPTAVAGRVYEFYVIDADGIKVVANTGDNIRVAASVSANAGNIVNNTIGGSVRLVAINATNWVATNVVGTWTVT